MTDAFQPYDCGVFLSKHLSLGTSVFQNAKAVYLSSASSENGQGSERVIPSPLNIGIENSRRFRALPVYASLAAYGSQGYQDMLLRQIRLAREIARFIELSDDFELLPQVPHEISIEERLKSVYMIVLFRARNKTVNDSIVQRMNGTRQLYVTGTKWEGRPAARFAIANWMVDPEPDLEMVKDVLRGSVKQG